MKSIKIVFGILIGSFEIYNRHSEKFFKLRLYILKLIWGAKTKVFGIFGSFEFWLTDFSIPIQCAQIPIADLQCTQNKSNHDNTKHKLLNKTKVSKKLNNYY